MASSLSADQLAFVAGGVWLDAGVHRTPDPNEIACIADRLDPGSDSLSVARACVEVAELVAWVMSIRARRGGAK